MQQGLGLSAHRVLPVASPPRQRERSAVRVSAVLVPVDRSQAASRASPPSGFSTLFAAFRASQRASDALSSLEDATKRRAEQADAIEEREKAAKDAGPLPDISSYLRPAGVMEARYVRLLSSLSALTYHLDRLTPSSLMRRHRLKLVSTSKICSLRLREPRASPADAVVLGDAMAGDPLAVMKAQQQIAASAERAGTSLAMRAVARVAPLSSTASLSSLDQPAGEVEGKEAAGQSPYDRVAASLSAAASAATAAAQGVYSAAVPYAGPLANNITTFTASITSSLPIQSVSQQLQSAAGVGHSSAIATVATVSAALESSWSPKGRLPKECQSPTEWFIADDTAAHTRYFVIQGSDTVDHWRVNLTFDPVIFEDEALGVKVHRGVYEAAGLLYDRFLPLVQDHLASSPFAKVAFTGHSLGGSLGTVLMLMFVRRGVLPLSAISPVYTFGAPAVFCEGSRGCDCPSSTDSAASEDEAAAQPATGAAGGLLQALRLPEGAVRNVFMHRDIVPRAFACDYSLVADLLKRVSESFRDHRCLNSSRTVMFDFIGKAMVLQPADSHTFAAREGDHPLLPPGPGLYVVREPTPFNTVAATLRRDAGYVRQAVHQAICNLASPPLPGPPSVLVPLAPAKLSARATAKAAKAQQPCRAVHSAREALWEFMNIPHPLDILADPGAYGNQGAISRFHDPDNYSRALGGVLFARGTSLHRLVSNATTSGMRYFAPPLDAAQQRAAAAAVAAMVAAPADVASSDTDARRPCHGGKQLLRMSRRRPSSAQLA